MKTILFCSAAMSAIAVAADLADTHMAFQEFLVKFGRSYASKNEIEERFDIFTENFENINNHNAKNDTTFKMAVNQFADLTIEEFNGRYHSAKIAKGVKETPTLIKSERSRPLLSSAVVPDEVDWNAAGKVSQPKD
mmetsp:Transcript_23029/g.16355  ORF Transcript_23029/g.16355 Transcript_23029/m.16355 type:complete len:136 (+) Transcript_23029:28-435(+)